MNTNSVERAPNNLDSWFCERIDPTRIELVASPELRAIYAYWADLCAGRPLPLKRDVRPTDLARLLPHVFMLDVLEAGAAYHVRIQGTRTRQYMDNLTGQTFHESNPELYVKRACLTLQRMVAECAPYRPTTARVRSPETISTRWKAFCYRSPMPRGGLSIAWAGSRSARARILSKGGTAQHRLNRCFIALNSSKLGGGIRSNRKPLISAFVGRAALGDPRHHRAQARADFLDRVSCGGGPHRLERDLAGFVFEHPIPGEAP